MNQPQTLEFLQAAVQKADDWMKELMETTGRPDSRKAWQMLRGVLHVLRDRMPVEQCAHVSAQLPMIIRGVYFEGWKPSDQPVKLRSRDEFIGAVAEKLSDHPEIDPNQAVEGVFRLLDRRIPASTLEKIKSMLQPELADLWPKK